MYIVYLVFVFVYMYFFSDVFLLHMSSAFVIISHTEEGHVALKPVCGENIIMSFTIVAFALQFEFEIELITKQLFLLPSFFFLRRGLFFPLEKGKELVCLLSTVNIYKQNKLLTRRGSLLHC